MIFRTTFPIYSYHNIKISECTICGTATDLGSDREIEVGNPNEKPDYSYRYEYTITSASIDNFLMPTTFIIALIKDGNNISESIEKGIYEHIHMIFNQQ